MTVRHHNNKVIVVSYTDFCLLSIINKAHPLLEAIDFDDKIQTARCLYVCAIEACRLVSTVVFINFNVAIDFTMFKCTCRK
jgi:hypothetical protein